MRNIVFDKRSFAEFTQWASEDRKIHLFNARRFQALESQSH